MERSVLLHSFKQNSFLENRFSTVEKECGLGVVASLKHFEVRLAGRPFTIVTDHRALTYLQSMKNANPRLTHWALSLQPFEFSIMHHPGRLHLNADIAPERRKVQTRNPALQLKRKEEC